MSESADLTVTETTSPDKVGLTIKKIKEIEEISERYLYENLDVKGELEKSILISQGLRSMREIVTDEIMAPLMELMGSTMGFVTDKDDKPEKYSVSEVKEVLIEGMLNGVFPYNNQLNIITGKLYIAKNGYTAKISKLRSVTDFVWRHEFVEKKDSKFYFVSFTASWKQNDIPKTLDGEIPIRRYSTDTPDVIMGKGERKLKYRCYCAMTETQPTESVEADKSEFENEKLQLSSIDQVALKAKEEAAGSE